MGCARIDSLIVRRPLERLSLVRRRHHCRASARNLDLSLALTWLLSRGEFFYSAKAYRCLDFSTERPVAFTSIVVRLVKKHVTFDNNYITFDTDLERDLNSVSPDHEIELQRSVLSDEYQKLSDQSQFVFSAGTCSPDQNK